MKPVSQKIWWALGLTLLAFSLVGANLLVERDSPAEPPAVTNSPAAAGRVTVLGVVAADPPEAPLGPPTIAPLLTVREVLVREGDLVQPDQPLVQFDDIIFQHKARQARAELIAAEQDLLRAQAAVKIQESTLAGQQLKIDTSQKLLDEARASYAIATQQFERVLANGRNVVSGQAYTEADKEQQRRENLELRQLAAVIVKLEGELNGEKLKLQGLAENPVQADVRAAEAKIERLRATVAEAETAIQLCVLRARVAGQVEQVHAVPGQVFGPTSRTPVLWLIPQGRRIVRVEVEPEFASRLLDKENRKVTITDGSQFDLTYEGTLRRVGTAFLTKRSQLDQLTVNSTKALEGIVDITDPAPSGRPSLRVGQPVRVLIP